MASQHLQPPPPSTLDFRTPDEWPHWKRRFEQFYIASGLSTEGGEKQVSALLYCMGENTKETMRSTRITPDEKKYYQTVVDKSDVFLSRPNSIVAFRRRMKLSSSL